MIKQILGQALYQVVAICVIIFWGDRFIPENLPDVTDPTGQSVIYSPYGKYVRSGRMQYPFSLKNDYEDLYEVPNKSFCNGVNQYVYRHTDTPDTSLSCLILLYLCKCSASSQPEELMTDSIYSKVKTLNYVTR